MDDTRPTNLLARLLQRLERYTRTDMTYLAKGGFWLALGHLVQIGSGLILVVAFANLLPKEVYGTYQFVLSMAAALSGLTLSAMDTAITRATARGNNGALRAGLRAQLVWSTAMILASGAVAVYYFLNGNTLLAGSFLVVGACTPLIEAFSLGRAYLTGKKLFKETALLGLGRRFLPVVALVSAVFLTKDAFILISIYFVTNALSAFLQYALIVHRYRLPIEKDPELIRFSKHLSFLRTISDIVNQADKVIVWALLGAVPVAVYTLAQLPITHMQGGLKLLRSLTLPKVSVTEFSILKETLPHKVRILVLASCIILALYILFAPFLFSVFFPAYPESVALSQALAFMLLSPPALYGQALIAHDKKRELYISNLSYNALKLVLLLSLVPFYGLWGAVAALLITHLFGNISTRMLFHRAR